MDVAVVGAGAMGGVWAARLADAGNRVAVVDAAPAVVAAIAADGLVVQDRQGASRAARVKATLRADEIGPVDAVFFFVKAQHTAAAARDARPLVGADTTVISLQNGWGNADVLAGVYPAERLTVGVTYHSASVRAPGRVAHTADQGPTFVGPYADGGDLARATKIGDLLTGAGLATTTTPAVKTEIWKKLILNCATLPTSALTRLRAGALGGPGPLLDLLDAITAEAVAVARAKGYAIDLDERVAAIHGLLARGGAGKSSMLQDIEGHRKTEIEVINGAVVRAAAEVGVAVPINRAMVALIGGVERAWERAA